MRDYLLVLQESKLGVGLFPIAQHVFKLATVFKALVSDALDESLFFLSI